MNKKIAYLLLFLLFVFPFDISLALEKSENEVNDNYDYTIKKYNTIITIINKKTVSIEEEFTTGILNEDKVFEKKFNNEVISIDSNFLELPNNSQVIHASEFNEKKYEIYLDSNKSYYLKYTVEIKDDKNYGLMALNYNPVYKKNTNTNYNYFNFKIDNCDKNTQDNILELSLIRNFDIKRNNNSIIGSATNLFLEELNDSKTNQIIKFYTNLQPSTNEFYMFGNITNVYFFSLSLIILFISLFISYIKIKSCKIKYDKYIFISLIIYGLVTIGILSLNSKNSINISMNYSILLLLLILISFYACFFKILFFKKNSSQLKLLFPRAFILVHFYFMLNGAASIQNLKFTSPYIILITIAIIVSAIAYDIEISDGIRKKKKYKPEEIENIYISKTKKINQSKTFQKYFNEKIKDKLIRKDMSLLLIFPSSLIFIIPIIVITLNVFEIFFELDNILYIVIINIIYFIILLYIFVIRPIKKYNNLKKLMNEGIIYKDIPFKYVKFKIDEMDKKVTVFKYKMEVQLNKYNNKFISDTKTSDFIYQKETCSMIILEDNPNIYYIDFEIPER